MQWRNTSCNTNFQVSKLARCAFVEIFALSLRLLGVLDDFRMLANKAMHWPLLTDKMALPSAADGGYLVQHQ